MEGCYGVMRYAYLRLGELRRWMRERSFCLRRVVLGWKSSFARVGEKSIMYLGYNTPRDIKVGANAGEEGA